MKERRTASMRRVRVAALLSTLSLLSSSEPALATISVLALSGSPAPDGNGAFASFGLPALNDAGQLVFRAQLTGTSGGAADDVGVYRASSGLGLQLFAREGQTAPNGVGVFRSLDDPSIASNGLVAFGGASTDMPTNAGQRAVYAGGSPIELREVIRTGQATTDGSGILSSIGSLDSNVAGQVSFVGEVNGGFPGPTREGIFKGNAVAGIATLSLEGRPAPTGVGVFNFYTDQLLNDLGQVAFRANIHDPSGMGLGGNGLFFGDGQSGIVTIARQGQTAPGGSRTFLSFNNYKLNESGSVSFVASFVGGVSPSSLFVADGLGGMVEVARSGDATPDGNGTLGGFENPDLNDAGVVAFQTAVFGAVGGGGYGVFRGDGSAALFQVARQGDLTPDGNRVLDRFRGPNKTAFV